MAMTKAGTIPNAGPTGIPYSDPVSLDQGGPPGVGGSADTINPPRVKATEPAGSGTPGAGANTDLFSPWHDGKGDTGVSDDSGQGGSNVDQAYPASKHLISGTPLPTSSAGQGRIMRGGRGGK
jgi:hypothetical protein